MHVGETQHAMHVQINIGVRLCSYSCSGTAMSIIQSLYVFVAVGIQHAMLMRRVGRCGLPRPTVFFHIIL